MCNDIFTLCAKSEEDGSDSDNSDKSKIDITITDRNRKTACDLISLIDVSKKISRTVIDTVDMWSKMPKDDGEHYSWIML